MNTQSLLSSSQPLAWSDSINNDNTFQCCSCEKEDGVPLASNDSDDDISDEDDNLQSQDKSSMYAYA